MSTDNDIWAFGKTLPELDIVLQTSYIKPLIAFKRGISSIQGHRGILTLTTDDQRLYGWGRNDFNELASSTVEKIKKLKALTIANESVSPHTQFSEQFLVKMKAAQTEESNWSVLNSKNKSSHGTSRGKIANEKEESSFPNTQFSRQLSKLNIPSYNELSLPMTNRSAYLEPFMSQRQSIKIKNLPNLNNLNQQTQNLVSSNSQLSTGVIASCSVVAAHVTLSVIDSGGLVLTGNRESVIYPCTNTKVPVNIPLVLKGSDFSGKVDKMALSLRMSISPKIKLVGVSACKTHAAVWDSSGGVYVWGQNNFGCLGVKNNLVRNFDTVTSPEACEVIKGSRIVACKVFPEVSFGLTHQGKLFVWGKALPGDSKALFNAQRMNFASEPNSTPQETEKVSKKDHQETGEKLPKRSGIIDVFGSESQGYLVLDAEGNIFSFGEK